MVAIETPNSSASPLVIPTTPDGANRILCPSQNNDASFDHPQSEKNNPERYPRRDFENVHVTLGSVGIGRASKTLRSSATGSGFDPSGYIFRYLCLRHGEPHAQGEGGRFPRSTNHSVPNSVALGYRASSLSIHVHSSQLNLLIPQTIRKATVATPNGKAMFITALHPEQPARCERGRLQRPSPCCPGVRRGC